MLYLNKEDIKKVFTMKDAIEADKVAFSIFSRGGAEVPLRNNFRSEAGDGNVLFMPGFVEELGCAAIKIVSVFPNNSSKGLPVTPATVALVSGQTGIVDAIMDGTYVTELRTGAASGAAIDVLAIKDAKRGALIGTGGQGESQLEAMLCTRDLDEVYVYSRSYDKCKAFADSMNEKLKAYNTKIIAAKTADEAVENADIIITATTSQKPVFDGSRIKKGALISGVGSYMPSMQEIDTITMEKADKIYCESVDAVLAEAGCLIKAIDAHGICNADITGELGAVIDGRIKGRESDDEIIVFKTVGIGVQDVVTAKYIYDKAVEAGVGTSLE